MDGAPDATRGKTTYINMRTCPALDNARFMPHSGRQATRGHVAVPHSASSTSTVAREADNLATSVSRGRPSTGRSKRLVSIDDAETEGTQRRWWLPLLWWRGWTNLGGGIGFSMRTDS